ncbi:uncharacterized protein A1O5_06416 [Cladophialophora psammophila CBS 110553]|uniref:Mitotic checkpoint regulator, MAD2B-interacting-domain-containing protein n=1 Tax=Cladophialophora psammophila CBS 110553 TaxID=1182543 RepID=W9WR27_9EURO|nr:uncharacterized protein A1O5_06416 [Cladophialophora psammophila CBS 110553]EXJ70348.1 hypothetical protein A1O5_06416 [Cladophialophora psammophila CBS 110553]
MSLVAYSDSESSEDEKIQPQPKTDKPSTKIAIKTNTNFTVNKANPRKIQVKLQDAPVNGDTDGEPAPKRPRIGGGGGTFSGFNAMLPAPKRDADSKAPLKPAARKVFSLKTGAEPGFSREADEELRNLFADQEHQRESTNFDTDETIPPIPKRAGHARDVPKPQPIQGNPFMFKPLSVVRNSKKTKKKLDGLKSAIATAQGEATAALSSDAGSAHSRIAEPGPPLKKVSLFSMDGGTTTAPQPQDQQEEDEIVEFLDEAPEEAIPSVPIEVPVTSSANPQPQSLDSIAADLNLSKADRRQLFGRRGRSSGTAINVVNFNTDQEYAANELLRATGEQVQHNPVRAIAPGKHSLKQLVNAATGQKEALEESFATGRRNKKEAGSKYGW